MGCRFGKHELVKNIKIRIAFVGSMKQALLDALKNEAIHLLHNQINDTLLVQLFHRCTFVLIPSD